MVLLINTYKWLSKLWVSDIRLKLRELNEEVGLVTAEDPELFGIYFHNYFDAYDYPIIYIVKNYSLTDIHSTEIKRKAWFHYDQLPEMVSPGTKRRLDEFFTQSKKSETW